MTILVLAINAKTCSSDFNKGAKWQLINRNKIQPTFDFSANKFYFANQSHWYVSNISGIAPKFWFGQIQIFVSLGHFIKHMRGRINPKQHPMFKLISSPTFFCAKQARRSLASLRPQCCTHCPLPPRPGACTWSCPQSVWSYGRKKLCVEFGQTKIWELCH